MNFAGLAWAVAYGFRPRAVHIRLEHWLQQEATYTSMPRAKETIFPFVVSLLMHQQAQGFIASLDCNAAECVARQSTGPGSRLSETTRPIWVGTGRPLRDPVQNVCGASRLGDGWAVWRTGLFRL